jgi:hypothetical protein
MEGLTRLVSESLARYGLDRPVDYRRLQWSRWFRCESLHSLLHVPSKPGIFALAEEIMDLGIPAKPNVDRVHVGTAALGCPVERSSTVVPSDEILGGAALQRCNSEPLMKSASAADGPRRMLSVLQFHEDDDMAYVLDRMLSRHNPLSARLASGRCFVRFVVIDDAIQRRSICNALNQWLVSTSETVAGIGAHFATSLDFVARAPSPATADAAKQPAQAQASEVERFPHRDPSVAQASPPDSGFATNIHCPHPLPSGF